jgi:thiosulfate/3-mercaptopyruvate sulfurtransferase
MKKTEYSVDGEWLIEQLDNPQVVIVDCRFQLANPDWGAQKYSESHIKAAHYLDLNRDLSSSVQLHGGRHPLPDMNALAQKFSAMGIVRNETLVVAYDDSRFAFAARLWWLLRYLGHDLVVLLDGGWNEWLKHDYPISKAIPQNKAVSFTPQPNEDWLVDIEAIKSAQKRDSLGQNQTEIIIVDSRDRDRYLGLIEPIDPIAGSIPGAVNSPWQQISDQSGYLQPLATQQQLWSEYRQAEEIIVYCGSGVTACVNLFSLSLAGFKNTRLYSGGWSDWCSYLVD